MIDDDASRTPDQPQRASASHPALSFKAAQASVIPQTPAGQAAPAGQSDWMAFHSQPAFAAHVSALPFAPHGSFTNVAGTTWLLAWV